jgi:hypothetical protein
VIYILFGCSVSVILKQISISGAPIQLYKFIDESFIYGQMDGEAVTGLQAESKLKNAKMEIIVT